MRTAAVLALPLLANAAVVGSRHSSASPLWLSSLTERIPWFGALLGNAISGAGVAPILQAHKIEEIPALYGGKRLRITYGPYKLGMAEYGQNMGNYRSLDKGGNGYLNFVGDEFPKDVTVLETSTRIVDENYNETGPEQGIYNHHDAFLDFSKRPKVAYACKSDWFERGAMMPFSVFSAGATEKVLVRYMSDNPDVKTGYYLGKDRHIMMMVDVINYNNMTKTVYTQTDVEFLPGKPAGYLDTTQSILDPGLCEGEHGFLIKPKPSDKKFDVVSNDVIAANDGYIVNMRGHMHDGGVAMRLKVNGQDVCISNATYGGDGHVGKNKDGSPWETINETSMCSHAVKVKKGDKIEMTAHYDLSLHPSREMGSDGMGGGGMSSHGGGMSGGMGSMSGGGDGGHGHEEAAEQMGLFLTYFAPTS